MKPRLTLMDGLAALTGLALALTALRLLGGVRLGRGLHSTLAAKLQRDEGENG